MKVYLAGPDVFLPDAAEIGSRKRALCRNYELEGLFPLDNEIKPTEAEAARRIFLGNISMLAEAEVIAANLTPFRGVSAEAGTVFELGYAFASGVPAFGYTNVSDYLIDRVVASGGGTLARVGDRPIAPDGLTVENFALFDNLMIAGALRASGHDVIRPNGVVKDIWHDLETFERCLRIIVDDRRRGLLPRNRAKESALADPARREHP